LISKEKKVGKEGRKVISAPLSEGRKKKREGEERKRKKVNVASETAVSQLGEKKRKG